MDIIKDFNLKQHNTFGVEARAALCTVIRSLDDIQNVISENRSLEKILYPIGGGSNILLTDDLDFWVLINEMRGIEVVEENDHEVVLNVKSGENWHQFVLYCLAQKWYGLENLSLIPGLVGASPIQNIGAYGVEVKDFIESVNYIDLESGEELSLSNSEMNFAYRNSIFKNELKGKIFITSVQFKLHKSPKVNVKYKALTDEIDRRKITDPSPKDVSDAVIAVRRSKLPDPAEIGNSGSFFKNPVVDRSVLEKIHEIHPDVPFYPAEDNRVKLAAGWLIEKAGWKGFREGDIGVHEKQALVLVNYGKGRGEDLKQLSQRIIDDIQDKFDVLLEREVNVL